MYLPQEIWDYIFDLKEQLEIKVPGKYIIVKTIDGKVKEQIATVCSRYKNKQHAYTYEYYYGIMGFHEGFCTKDKIRELTPEEQNFHKQHKIFNLPQQFYHSVPQL